MAGHDGRRDHARTPGRLRYASKRRGRFPVVLAALALFIAGCSGAETGADDTTTSVASATTQTTAGSSTETTAAPAETESDRHGGTLTFGSVYALVDFDPFLTTGFNNHMKHQLYSHLAVYSADYSVTPD